MASRLLAVSLAAGLLPVPLCAAAFEAPAEQTARVQRPCSEVACDPGVARAAHAWKTYCEEGSCQEVCCGPPAPLECGRDGKRHCSAELCGSREALRAPPCEQECLGESCTFAECCIERGVCSPDLCTEGIGRGRPFLQIRERGVCGKHRCRGPVCTSEECCLPARGSCSNATCGVNQEVCGPGYHQRNNTNGSHCLWPECQQHECCEKIYGKCDDSVCPAHHRLRLKVPRRCGDATCEVEECCDRILASCLAFRCPEGHRLRSTKRMPQVCEGPACTAEECCFPLARCSAEVCPVGRRLRPDARHCAGRSCAPADCCEPDGLGEPRGCAGFECPPNFQALARASCETAECRQDECCNPRRPGVCASIECPAGFRMRSAETTCAGAQCRSDECCERVDACTAALCAQAEPGSGLVLKDATQLPSSCAGPACTVEECCQAASTPPIPPPTPAPSPSPSPTPVTWFGSALPRRSNRQRRPGRPGKP